MVKEEEASKVKAGDVVSQGKGEEGEVVASLKVEGVEVEDLERQEEEDSLERRKRNILEVT